MIGVGIFERLGNPQGVGKMEADLSVKISRTSAKAFFAQSRQLLTDVSAIDLEDSRVIKHKNYARPFLLHQQQQQCGSSSFETDRYLLESHASRVAHFSGLSRGRNLILMARSTAINAYVNRGS